MADTSIAVSDEVWGELHRRKQRGDTFDDVLRRELDLGHDEQAGEQKNRQSLEHLENGTLAPKVPDEIPNRISDESAADAIAAAVAFIEDQNGASMREIVSEVMPEHDLGYDVPELQEGDRYRGSWWRNVIKPALEQEPSVEKPDNPSSPWKVKNQ